MADLCRRVRDPSSNSNLLSLASLVRENFQRHLFSKGTERGVVKLCSLIFGVVNPSAYVDLVCGVGLSVILLRHLQHRTSHGFGGHLKATTYNRNRMERGNLSNSESVNIDIIDDKIAV